MRLNKSVKMKPVSALLMNKALIVNNKVKLKLVEGLGPVESRMNTNLLGKLQQMLASQEHSQFSGC